MSRRKGRTEETQLYLKCLNQRSLKPEDRKEEDIKKFVGFCKGIIKINLDHTMIEHIIRLGKAMDD